MRGRSPAAPVQCRIAPCAGKPGIGTSRLRSSRAGLVQWCDSSRTIQPATTNPGPTPMHSSIRRGSIFLLVAAMHPTVTGRRAGRRCPPARLSPAVKESLDRISADSLRGHLSFLASDLLEGRGTPSKGSTSPPSTSRPSSAAPGSSRSATTATSRRRDWKYLAPDPESFACEVKVDGRSIPIAVDHASGSLGAAVDLPPTAIDQGRRLERRGPQGARAAQVKGKVVLAELPNPYKVDRSRIREANRARLAFLQRMDELKPALIVDVDRDTGSRAGPARDVGGRRSGRSRGPCRRITLHSPQLARAFDAMPAGPSGATLSLHVGEPKERTTKVRNVIGLLRGSDPALKETYVHPDRALRPPRHRARQRLGRPDLQRGQRRRQRDGLGHRDRLGPGRR